MKISPQSKSFLILFGIAIVGTMASVFIDGQLDARRMKAESEQANRQNQNATPTHKFESPKEPPVDTSSWVSYTDSKYNFSFKHPKEWKVLAPAKKDGDFFVLQIDPGQKFYNVKIYISPTDYLGLSGVPVTEETINGNKATNLNDVVYGLNNGRYYFTFEIGLSLSIKPEFKALVHSVTFPAANP